MPIPVNNLLYYFNRVQLKAGYQVTQFPNGIPTDFQQKVIDALNETLRYLNNNYWLSFQQTEYLLNTIPNQSDYDISLPPYSQIFWRVERMARNGCIRNFDGIPLQYVDYQQIDAFRPQFAIATLPIFYTGFGLFLRFYPKPNGTVIKVRYYPTAIASDFTGATLQSKLILLTDVPTLGDEWEDVLVTIAAYRLRILDKADARTAALRDDAGRQEAIIAEKHKPGEECHTVFSAMQPSRMNRLQSKIWPFLTPYQL